MIGQMRQRIFDEALSFGARNQGAPIRDQIEIVELAMADDIGQRLILQNALEFTLKAIELRRFRCPIEPRQQLRARDIQHKGQDHFRRQARRIYAGCFELFGRLLAELLKGQKISSRGLSLTIDK